MNDGNVLETDIPKYDETMLPLLRLIKDGNNYRMSDVVLQLEDIMGLTETQRKQPKASGGSETLFRNRVNWAKLYLKRAGLVEDPQRAHTRITEKGKIWAEREQLTAKDLNSIPKFVEWDKNSNSKTDSLSTPDKIPITNETPDDITSRGILTSHQNTKFELLEKLKKMDPFEFEKINGLLLERMGYGKATITKRSNDGGIDGFTEKDELGFEKIRFQSKRYSGNVGVGHVREFLGTVPSGQKGIMITTSSFGSNPSDALNNAQRSSDEIKFVDGETLVELMIKYKIGVKIADTYHTYEINEEFFTSETLV